MRHKLYLPPVDIAVDKQTTIEIRTKDAQEEIDYLVSLILGDGDKKKEKKGCSCHTRFVIGDDNIPY